MSIKINEKTSEISKKIEKIFIRQVYLKLKNVSHLIKEEIKRENINIWRKTETYRSLLSGDLNHEFGFPKGTAKQRVETVLDVLGNSISVIPKIKDTKSSSKNIVLDIRIFTKNIPSQVFFMNESIVETEKAANNDISSDFGAYGATEIKKQLPWLHWLLYRGNRYIIFGYEYSDVISPRSRSGKGLMVHSDNNWKVPAEFSGTKNSHWLIRALKDNRQYLISEYSKIIQKHL